LSKLRAACSRSFLLVGFGGALLLVAAATAGPSPSAAGAAPAAVADVWDSADATAPAERLRPPWSANFPVATSPRCDILDNFGDPRSGGRTHAGTDILTTKGQEVYAMVDGTLTLMVVAGSSQSGASLSGNLWQLTAANGTYYIYAHLDAFAPGLAKGSTVVAGQVLGWTGDTGNPGPGNYHLHFEIHPGGGAAVDPLPLLTVPAACRVY
jgi:murein DD-endopeptidase MepM/ murein hydrolase activator NlpD